MSASQINDLAKPLIDIVSDYFNDEVHRREFEEWMKRRNTHDDYV